MQAVRKRHEASRHGFWLAARLFVVAALVAPLLALAPAGHAAPNDFEVQASNVAAIKIGDFFAKGAQLVLPVGAALTLIDRTGNPVRMRDCGGSYTGPIENCPAPPTGRNSDGSMRAPGGTRGAVR
jgi:hypothetical protein